MKNSKNVRIGEKKEYSESQQVTHLIHIKLGLASGQLSVACAELADEIVAACEHIHSDMQKGKKEREINFNTGKDELLILLHMPRNKANNSSLSSISQ